MLDKESIMSYMPFGKPKFQTKSLSSHGWSITTKISYGKIYKRGNGMDSAYAPYAKGMRRTITTYFSNVNIWFRYEKLSSHIGFPYIQHDCIVESLKW